MFTTLTVNIDVNMQALQHHQCNRLVHISHTDIVEQVLIVSLNCNRGDISDAGATNKRCDLQVQVYVGNHECSGIAMD